MISSVLLKSAVLRHVNGSSGKVPTVMVRMGFDGCESGMKSEENVVS